MDFILLCIFVYPEREHEMNKTTLVLGASEKSERYSNKAIKALSSHGIRVLAIGLRNGKVDDTVILTGLPDLTGVDTVTIYLSPKNQAVYYDYILSLKPRRLIFNPGTENEALEKIAADAGILCENACTLVLLATNQY